MQQSSENVTFIHFINWNIGSCSLNVSFKIQILNWGQIPITLDFEVSHNFASVVLPSPLLEQPHKNIEYFKCLQSLRTVLTSGGLGFMNVFFLHFSLRESCIWVFLCLRKTHQNMLEQTIRAIPLSSAYVHVVISQFPLANAETAWNVFSRAIS